MSSAKWQPFCLGLNVQPVSHRSPVDSPHKGQWREALRFPLMCTRTNGWANNRHAADLRRHRTHYGIIVMWLHGTGKMPRLLRRREETSLNVGRDLQHNNNIQHFKRYVWYRSPVNSPHKGQWRGALIFSLICARIKSCANKREAGGLRRYRAHYGVTVMWSTMITCIGLKVISF